MKNLSQVKKTSVIILLNLHKVSGDDPNPTFCWSDVYIMQTERTKTRILRIMNVFGALCALKMSPAHSRSSWSDCHFSRKMHVYQYRTWIRRCKTIKTIWIFWLKIQSQVKILSLLRTYLYVLLNGVTIRQAHGYSSVTLSSMINFVILMQNLLLHWPSRGFLNINTSRN
jgi:hypothetical protein